MLQDDLLELLAKAVTCAVLGKSGQTRTRVLATLHKVGIFCRRCEIRDDTDSVISMRILMDLFASWSSDSGVGS